MKIVCCIEGGNLTSIHSTVKLEIEVIDFDNLKAEGETEEQIAELFRTAISEETENGYQVPAEFFQVY